jgi:hypothetical protein
VGFKQHKTHYSSPSLPELAQSYETDTFLIVSLFYILILQTVKTMAESSTLREENPVTTAPSADQAECEAGTDNNNNNNNNTSDTATITSAAAATTTSESSTKSSAVSEPEMVMSPENEAALQQLARQVEYYFSTANLTRDTYVSTLRSLNDGYVPVSIIANFGKVRALAPYDSLNAVRMAATDYSELLEVVQINTLTSKRVSLEEANDDNISTNNKILDAVGPVNGQPIPMSSLPHITIVASPTATAKTPAASPVPSSPAFQNTVILRETPSDIQDEHVRELFDFEKCPPIQSVHLDLANCW